MAISLPPISFASPGKSYGTDQVELGGIGFDETVVYLIRIERGLPFPIQVLLDGIHPVSGIVQVLIVLGTFDKIVVIIYISDALAICARGPVLVSIFERHSALRPGGTRHSYQESDRGHIPFDIVFQSRPLQS